VTPDVAARAAVDGFRPQWDSFAAFFSEREDIHADFLLELDHQRGIRQPWTVGEWRARVHATTAWLEEQGVGPGAAVATLAGNTADALALAYGCWVLGACVVPLNPGDSVERQRFILRDARAVLLVHAEDAAERAAELAAEGLRTMPTAELPTASNSASGSPTGAPDGLEAVALRVYTSGTTGDPKGVVLTAANLLTDCDALARALEWPGDTRILTVLPVHHVNGLVISSLLPWYSRLSTVLCDRFRSETFWDDAEREGATVCSVVPSLLEFLLRSPGRVPDRFREFLCGAGPLLVDTVVECEQHFRRPIRHLYGLSETTAVVTLMPRLPDEVRTEWHRAHGFPSIGPAVPHVEVTVLDLDGRPVAAGQRGELAVRGAVVMREYAGQPEATAAALAGGWFHTGDEGFWQPGEDDRPYFFITGRIKEIIVRGGSNVSPVEVDSVLRSHPAVEYALAVPFENRFYGEEIAAYVVPNREVTEAELLAHCARSLDHARCPKVIVFGDDVPFTATGKAKRLELKRRLAAHLVQYRDVQFRRSRSGAP
jgi:long-chain acyl-CoA synthetase